MNKAIFLDRDGVINKERGEHTWKIEDFEFCEEIAEALLSFQNKGYLLIVITNQSGIAKGLYAKEDVHKLHARMMEYFAGKGVILTDIFYCPHHDSSGKCLCRKPGSLLIEKALAKHQINPELSRMIGDKDRDIQAAEQAGVKGIKIKANSSLLALSAEIKNGF